jgi:hypothetical protein
LWNLHWAQNIKRETIMHLYKNSMKTKLILKDRDVFVCISICNFCVVPLAHYLPPCPLKETVSRVFRPLVFSSNNSI